VALALLFGVHGHEAPHARGRPACRQLTVSQSEAGFERIMQGAVLTLKWRLDPPAEITVVLEVKAG